MKRFLKIFSALTMIVLILAVSVMPSFAAGELTVNGTTAKKDDVVTYTLMLADCEEPVVGFHMYIDYDKEYLQMVGDSLNFGDIDSEVIDNGSNQENYNEGIIFVYTNPSNPADFSKAKKLATVDFKVLKGGETNIEFFVTDLYGMDMTYMKSYTFTYNLEVNDEPVIEGEPPVLVTDQAFLNENQGQFINYADGKGELNGSAEADATRETVMGVTTAPATDVLKGTEANETTTVDLTTIIVLIAVVLLVLIIVVLVIVRNALNRSKREEAVSTVEEKTE